jgi:CBS domain containing-hemolysin-like protein
MELIGFHRPVASHAAASAVAFVGITFLHTVVGELAPKSVAIQRAEATTLFSAFPLRVFYVVMYPLIELLNGSARLLLRGLGLHIVHGNDGGAHSESELRMIVASSHAHGVLDRSTRELLERVLAYRSRIVREVMTPRADVTILNVRAPLEETLRLAQETGYTRYPLWDDSQARVLGFVHIRDLLTYAPRPDDEEPDLRTLAREPLIVRETTSVDRVRRVMQRRRTHFAIVVDEANEFVGVVSLEDLIEEIVGDIEDEFDEAGVPRSVRVDEGVFEIDGGLLIEEMEQLLELTLPDRPEGVDTIAGYVLNILGRLPDPGEVVDLAGLRLDVLSVDRLRIRRLRVRRKALSTNESFRVDFRNE